MKRGRWFKRGMRVDGTTLDLLVDDPCGPVRVWGGGMDERELRLGVGMKRLCNSLELFEESCEAEDKRKACAERPAKLFLMGVAAGVVLAIAGRVTVWCFGG